MRIRYKLLSGFLLINVILVVAGVMSISNLVQMRDSTINIIDGNYNLLHQLNLMLKSVEKEDKAVLMLMLGQWESGREIISKADSSFNKSYLIALQYTSNNKALQHIGKQYAIYKHIWELPIVDTKKEGNIEWYYTTYIPAYQNIKEVIEQAIEFSEQKLHNEAKQLANKYHQSLMPGIIAIISAIILSFLMYFFTTRFFSKPIEDILEGVKDYNQTGKRISMEVNSNDEIRELLNEIKKLTENR